MSKIGRVDIRVFSKQDEDDSEAIKKALDNIVPFDMVAEKLGIEEQKASGFFEKKISIFSINLKRSKHIRGFASKLIDNLGKEQKRILLKQIESRLDVNNDFFIRLCKSGLMAGKLVLTDSGNCFHITFNVVTYPKSRESAISYLKELLN